MRQLVIWEEIKMGISNIEEMKAKKDVEGLREALKDEYWRVRMGAADALGEIGDERVATPLKQILKDKSWLVRTSAQQSLDKIIDQLGFCISSEASLSDRMDWDYYNARVPVASDALVSIGKSDVDQIVKFLKKKERLILFGIPYMWALCEIGDRKATGAVINCIFSV